MERMNKKYSMMSFIGRYKDTKRCVQDKYKDVVFETSNGDITVTIPKDIKFSVDEYIYVEGDLYSITNNYFFITAISKKSGHVLRRGILRHTYNDPFLSRINLLS
jgi:hypothetical protein